MKILLTGGDDFIGKNFIEKFGGRYDIIAPTQEECDLNNVRDVAAYFEGKSFDCVIHTVGAQDEENSLVAFKNIQYFSVLSGVKKLIVLSDPADLDTTRPLENVSENALEEREPKAANALGCHLITKLAAKDKISTVLRLFNVYGKYCDVGSSKTMELIARGVTGKKTATIEHDRELSLIYIDDVLKVLAAFIEGDVEKGVYNVASDRTMRLTDIAKTARRLAAKDFRSVDIEIISPEFDPPLTANVEKLCAALPKLKFTTHSAGIKAVHEHLMKHKSQAKPQK